MKDVLCWVCQADAVRLAPDGEGRCSDCPDCDELDDAAEQLADAERFESRYGA